MAKSAHSTYGIIGYPVEHSLSPLLHNTAFKELKLDAVYKPFPLKENELDSFFQDLRDPQSLIFGLNVTIPYKEKVVSYCDCLSPFAEQVGAVNTIVIDDQRKIIGHNTDGPGFLAHLTELKFETHKKRVAILGAGGTTRAILAALCLIPDQPLSIRLYNRTFSNAESLVADLSSRLNMRKIHLVSSIEDLNIELADLLINTTSLGMKPSDPCLINPQLLHSDMLVYDVIYNPRETPLLKLAKEQGAKAANGLGMLFYQGVLAFQHWADVELDTSTKIKMRQNLEKGARPS